MLDFKFSDGDSFIFVEGLQSQEIEQESDTFWLGNPNISLLEAEFRKM